MPFPNNPTVGQTYTDSYGTVWTYNGFDWGRTTVSSDNETSYRFDQLPSGGAVGQVLTRSAEGGIEWTDAASDVTALLARVSALETAVASLQANDYLII